MQSTPHAHRILELDDPAAALVAMGEELSSALPLRGARWYAGDRTLRGRWPEAELAAAAGAPRTVAFSLRPAAGRVELLYAADPDGAQRAVAEECVRAFARVVERHDRLAAVERERDDLRRRAEESEALNLLGLAANRTLDPDEVLTVVARLTRTLLGAHYVTVNTVEDSELRLAASIGLGDRGRGDRDLLAARVVADGRPLVLGGEEMAAELEALPLHRAEGMQAGLGVPLSLFGETFGALVVGYRRPYRVEARDTRLALTLASHGAVAISNARFHRALAERSVELERTYEELRWSSESKERFFATMNHELRTPLNAVLGYQSLILDGVAGEPKPEIRAFLEKAHRATGSLLMLVNDLLDLSRLAAGKVDLALAPTHLADAVDEAVTTIRPIAGERGIEVQVEVQADLPLVDTDAHRVRQILVNLLGNAIKFTPAGGVRVEVAMAEEPEGSDEVEIRVVDSGSGIAAVDQERIFHEFEQVSGLAARGGTGLGLPISRKLARLLGGDLTVHSELGVGSTFVLRIPRVRPEG